MSMNGNGKLHMGGTGVKMMRLQLYLPFLAIVFVPSASIDQDKKASSPPRGPVVLTEKALRLHADALVFDGHNDLPWKVREKDDLFFKGFDLTKPQPSLHTDIPRLRKGNVGAQFWSAYVPAETAKAGTAVRMT